jgi:hypothetical protein
MKRFCLFVLPVFLLLGCKNDSDKGGSDVKAAQSSPAPLDACLGKAAADHEAQVQCFLQFAKNLDQCKKFKGEPVKVTDCCRALVGEKVMGYEECEKAIDPNWQAKVPTPGEF